MNLFKLLSFVLIAVICLVSMYEAGHQAGNKETLEQVQTQVYKDLFLEDKDIREFIDWKKSCEFKWKVTCSLHYFKLNGVGVYQVEPKVITKE